MSRNTRAYFLVVLFAIILTILVILGISQGWAIFRSPQQETYANEDVFNMTALESGAVDVFGADLAMTLFPPSSAEEERLLTIAINNVVLYVRVDDPDINPQDLQACVDYLFITTDPTDEFAYHYYADLDSGQAICFPLTEQDFVGEQDFDGTLADNIYEVGQELEGAIFILADAELISQNFWYPYDGFTINPVIQMVYSIVNGDEVVAQDTITPYFAWNYKVSGTRLWDISLETSLMTMSDENTDLLLFPGDYEQVTLTMQRPLLYRVVFPAFLVVMVLLIALVPLLGDRDTLVDISAAMLFGIFGLKGILGPADAMGQTILDIGLIGLYAVLAFAGILFFANKLSERRREKETA
jgi:hypothetical protein